MSLDTLIANAQMAQDIELAQAITELQSNPTKLNAFLQQQQNNVYKKISKQKDDTFEKVYGDLKRSQKYQESLLKDNNTTSTLSSVYDDMYKNQQNELSSSMINNNTHKRKYEMNEWTVNNKKDTLFVMSALFIGLSIILLFTVLYKMNIISLSVWGFTFGLVLIIFVLIVINRAQYTNLHRNLRYWNKKQFGGQYGKIPIPSICPDPVESTPASKPASA
jgi:hypothetical protein